MYIPKKNVEKLDFHRVCQSGAIPEGMAKNIELVYFHFVLPTIQLFVDECNKGMIFL